MGRFMKILAILALVATIAGAGAVLYGINTLAPQVVQTAANVTEAQSVADTFDDMVTRWKTARSAAESLAERTICARKTAPL
ncbi:MAG: hypothetical protein ACLUMK_07540 [Christensenellales bacterium]